MSSPFPRSLRADEQAVLDRLLSRDFKGAHELRTQAGLATVTGKCDCGCPTINLAVSDQAPRADVPGPLALAELTVTPLDGGTEGTVILFVSEGLMSSLEYVWYGESAPTSWPSIDRLIDAP
jgi:hypothetical protein